MRTALGGLESRLAAATIGTERARVLAHKRPCRSPMDVAQGPLDATLTVQRRSVAYSVVCHSPTRPEPPLPLPRGRAAGRSQESAGGQEARRPASLVLRTTRSARPLKRSSVGLSAWTSGSAPIRMCVSLVYSAVFSFPCDRPWPLHTWPRGGPGVQPERTSCCAPCPRDRTPVLRFLWNAGSVAAPSWVRAATDPTLRTRLNRYSLLSGRRFN
jgi:hypothetical protein